MRRDRFVEIRVGDEARFTHCLTQQDVDRFVDLTRDDNPLHTDAAFAGRTEFKKPVVHGMLTASFLSRVIGAELPGPGAVWYEQTLRFLSPARVNEAITVLARVTQKSEAQRILILSTKITGDDGRLLVEGEAKVKVIETQIEEDSMSQDKGAVIITGASRGIGAAVARTLAADGFAVAVNYDQDEAGAFEVARSIETAGGRAMVFRADVTDEVAVQAMVEAVEAAFGPLSGVVNNAGGPVRLQTFDALAWEDFQSHLDVQLKGAFHVCQAVLPRLVARGGGVVINIGSVAAENVPPIRMTAYAAAKAALMCLSRSLAQEFGPKGVRVNCVAPGMVNTGLIANFPDKAKMVTKMQTPLRRLAEQGDVAGAVAFLFSERAAFLSGQTLRVCGGATME
jgi:3-oxoacyl-[acyl-carrier protein] reductase